MRSVDLESEKTDRSFCEAADSGARVLAEQRSLARACRRAVENERRRIGQELHDALCQNLLGAAFTVKAVADRLPPACAEAAELELVARLVNDAVRQARDIALGLSPGELSKRR